MKGVTALLLLAIVGCHAGVITIRTQVCTLTQRPERHGTFMLGSSPEAAEGVRCCVHQMWDSILGL